MFLRDREPNEGQTKIGRGIRTGHLIGTVVFTAFINVSVAVHLIRFGPSSDWVSLQVAAGVLQLVAIGGLVWVITKFPHRPSSGD